MTSTDAYLLKWHSYSSHLNGSVAALLRSERFTDVVLCTMDGSQIPAHKFILSSCSVYLCNLFEGQRSVTRMGGMLYVVLPSEISTKTLKILVEYMYKGETTVSNEVLDTVLKAGEVLKIRGLWRQTEDGGEGAPDKIIMANINKQVIQKKADDGQPKLAIKEDDKLLKAFSIVQPTGVTRPMFIRAPKLVFIKTADGTTQPALRPIAPKGQTILVAPAPSSDGITLMAPISMRSAASVATLDSPSVADDSSDDIPPPGTLRRHAAEWKYGKTPNTETAPPEPEETKESDEVQADSVSETSKKSPQSASEATIEVQVKDEPEWDASSIEEEERSIAEMSQAEINVKSEPIDEVEIEEHSLVYSPLACELCAEVFTVPAAWVRHVQQHARADHHHPRKRKLRSDSDDTEETMALLRCNLCQKHFPNPGEWVRHIQSTHTESVFKKRKTNAEMCRNYYNRKKAAKEAERIRQGLPVKKPRKTGAERTRACRMRKNMLAKVNESSVTEIISVTPTSNSDATSASTNRPDVSTVSSTGNADDGDNVHDSVLSTSTHDNRSSNQSNCTS